MIIESKRFEDLGYYILGYNDHEIVYEKIFDCKTNPYFKRIILCLDNNTFTAQKCYVTTTKWKTNNITQYELDAVNDLFARYNNA